MQALVWLISGLLAGWLARLVMKEERIGFLADVTLGILGGVSGAWMLRSVGGSVPPAGSPAHLAVAVIGAMVLVGIARLLWRFTRRVKISGRSGAMPVVSDLEGYVRRLGQVERRVFSAILRRQTIAKDVEESFQEQLTFGQRVADRVAEFGGSWTFLGLFAAFMLGWMFLNSAEARRFDPYPFILLNLILSCLAAVQAPVIMMSQNRQTAKDRFEAQQDYQVNLKAEMEIMAIHTKLDEARDLQWNALLELQNRQMTMLYRLEQRFDAFQRNAGHKSESDLPE
jgi:uncharacterized membrane protein/uncharacterized membrane protein YeaQ/YmgE (transglycosylase-associated protein family)